MDLPSDLSGVTCEWLTEVLARSGALPVPRCFHAALGDEQTFALVLEDLSEADPGHRLDGLTAQDAERVIDALARGRRWSSEAPVSTA